MNFYYRKGYEEARVTLENKKEEYEQAKFIVEEDLEGKTNNTTQGILKKVVTSQEEKIKRENQAAKELEEVFKWRKGKNKEISEQQEPPKKDKEEKKQKDEIELELEENNNKITIWDLLIWAKKIQVFEIVCFIGKVKHIEIIRTICDKTRAEVEFKAGTYDEEKIEKTWCLPFIDQLLVRITPGTNNQNLLYKRSKYSLRLLDLPENTNEVLL